MTNNATYALQDALDSELEFSIDTKVLEKVSNKLIELGWMIDK